MTQMTHQDTEIDSIIDIQKFILFHVFNPPYVSLTLLLFSFHFYIPSQLFLLKYKMTPKENKPMNATRKFFISGSFVVENQKIFSLDFIATLKLCRYTLICVTNILLTSNIPTNENIADTFIHSFSNY